MRRSTDTSKPNIPAVVLPGFPLRVLALDRQNNASRLQSHDVEEGQGPCCPPPCSLLLVSDAPLNCRASRKRMWYQEESAQHESAVNVYPPGPVVLHGSLKKIKFENWGR